MAEICIDLPDNLRELAEKFNLDLSKLMLESARREILKQQLLKKLSSKEEQELVEWSVDLGRRAKKGRFKKLSE